MWNYTIKIAKKSLFYICIFLVNKQQKLFNDKFERWDLGPVIKNIYSKYKKYRDKPIEVPKNKVKLNKITNLEKIELDSLLFELNKFSTTKLIDFSHECDPWKETPKNKNISDEKIINYYSKNDLFKLLGIKNYTLLDLSTIRYD
ncbi:type II toxin-antitoxin system antitoxin SocA domain-containing protein [Spiroplasma phoeniceum]|uniref:Phage-Associated Protein n=1 Tax=Spiroplasma phoeniceum P40 TaxID=1276259 RepID=A0A345DPT6_9MOLU|nr:type II toxin-antitoxin system antitoxin SocA domain-containing protein [Spiroplasma phoeniceum]AXF96224.1 Phage-Associated Protein [Spiroplasma phoeniceum P40]